MKKFKFVKGDKWYKFMRAENVLTAEDIPSLSMMINEFEDLKKEEEEILMGGDIYEIRDFYSKVGDMNLLEAEYEVLVSRYHDLQGDTT